MHACSCGLRLGCRRIGAWTLRWIGLAWFKKEIRVDSNNKKKKKFVVIIASQLVDVGYYYWHYSTIIVHSIAAWRLIVTSGGRE